MSRTAAQPGRRVASGHLRVDAARAVKKLREYQLTDPVGWVLEAMRAGVAAGATALALDGDADDVWLGWEGAAVLPADLPRLFDELVSPRSADERRHLRLLAIGVNSALALSPRFVDVYSIDASARARRVRYVPDVLEVDDEAPGEGATGLRALTVETVDAPEGAPCPGTFVHLRRGLGRAVFSSLLRGAGPPELSLARRAGDDLAIPFRLGRSRLGRERSTQDLLRLELGGGLDGFVALTDLVAPRTQRSGAWVDVAEHGVVLASYALDLGFEPLGPVPLRIFVDAPRMPTNASRSEVRSDRPPLAGLGERVLERLRQLVRILERELGEGAEHAWTGRARERLRRAALRLLASICAGPEWRRICRGREGVFPEWASRLRWLPVLADAVGRERSARTLCWGEGRIECVHRGTEHLPMGLEPWLGDVLWVPPGDPAGYLLGEWDPPHAEDLAERAWGYQRARDAFLEHAEVKPVVPEEAEQWIALDLPPPDDLPSCVPDAHFDLPDLVGQVVMHGRPGLGDARLLIQDREIERTTVHYPEGFTAIIGTALLAPQPDYRGVERGPGFDRAVLACRAGAVRAAEALARRLGGGGDDADPDDGAVLRGAIDPGRSRVAVRGAMALAADLLEDPMDVLGSGPFGDAPVWPIATADGEPRFVSIADIRRQVERDGGHLPVTSPGVRFELGPSRFLLALDLQERHLLVRLLGGLPDLVQYHDHLLPHADLDQAANIAELVAMRCGIALTLRGRGFRGAIGWQTGASEVELRHAGRIVAKEPASHRLVPFRLAVDKDDILPMPSWRGTAEPGERVDAGVWEEALCRAATRALLGDRVEGLVMRYAAVSTTLDVPRRLLAALGAAPQGARRLLGEELFARLRAHPFLELLGRVERASPNELLELFPSGLIPFLPNTTTVSFDVGGWHPLCLPRDLAESAAALVDREAVDATGELERRTDASLRERNITLHRSRLRDSGLLDSELPTIESGGIAAGVVGFRSWSGVSGAQVRVLIEERCFETVEIEDALPLEAVLQVAVSFTDSRFTKLSDAAMRAIRGALSRAAPKLLLAVAEQRPIALDQDPVARKLLHAWVRRVGPQPGKRNRAALEALAGAEAFPSVQGDRVGLAECARGAQLLVGSHSGDWLGPAEGARPNRLDRPVLQVPAGRDWAPLLEIYGMITDKKPLDVSRVLEQLQAGRRVERGLVPKPVLNDVPAQRRLSIYELAGDRQGMRAALGPGEVALIDGDGETLVRVFRNGVFATAFGVDVSPRMKLAVESPSLATEVDRDRVERRVQKHAQKLADLVVRRTLDEGPVDALPHWTRCAIRRAMLFGRVGSLNALSGLPFFETTAGEWRTLDELREQVADLGPLWTTPELSATERPLDARRFVLRLPEDETTRLTVHVLAIDGRDELRLDAAARLNLERPRVTVMQLDANELSAALTQVRLDGDGRAAPQGVVAALHPARHHLRAMRAHKDGRPLGRVTDPCGWPTLAVVDFLDISPDRTWSRPVDDEVWSKVQRVVRELSEESMASLFPAPEGAVAHCRVDASLSALAAGEEEIRGMLWLEPGVGSGRLEVMGASDAAAGPATFEADGGRREMPVFGRLMVHGSAHAPSVGLAALTAYRRMVGQLAGQVGGGASEDALVATAHVIHALACGAVRAEELERSGLVLESALPEALDVQALSLLFRSKRTVAVVHRDDLPRVAEAFPEGTAGAPSRVSPWIVDDGSWIVPIVVGHLGPRAQRWPSRASRSSVAATPSAPERPRTPPPPPTIEPLPSPAGPVTPPPFRRRSALELALTARLAAAGLEAQVIVRREARRPLIDHVPGEGEAYALGGLALAGRSDAIRAVEAALASSDPRAEAALDLLVAHAAGALDRAHTRVTEATQIEAMTRVLEPT